MSVAASGTIKTNPTLTLRLNAQMSTGQRRRTMEGLKSARQHGVRKTSASGRREVVIAFDFFDLMADAGLLAGWPW